MSHSFATARAETAPSRFFFTTPPRERVAYDVIILPPAERDWTLNQLYESEVSKEQVESFKRRLGEVLSIQNVRTAYAPTVRPMSGNVLHPESFTEGMTLPCGVQILRPTSGCDGLPLTQYSAFVASMGGCLTLVLSGYGVRGPVCIVSHAGARSLFDTRLIFEYQSSRKHFSVIDSMVREAIGLGLKLEETNLRIFGGIPSNAYPHAEDHPTHGKGNQVLLSFLTRTYGSKTVPVRDDGVRCLCISSLAMRQAELLGIGAIENVWELPYNGEYAYTSHDVPSLSNKVRNLVVVIRR